MKRRITSFAQGERGKFAGMPKLFVGATSKPISETKSIPNPTRRAGKLIVTIDDDLRTAFPDEDTVNAALRSLCQSLN